MIKFANYRKKIELSENIEELYYHILDSEIEGFNSVSSQLKASNLGIPCYAEFKYKINFSLWSFGEEIQVILEQTSNDFTSVEFLSQCSTFQFFAWGKNKKNWKHFYKTLKSI